MVLVLLASRLEFGERNPDPKTRVLEKDAEEALELRLKMTLRRPRNPQGTGLALCVLCKDMYYSIVGNVYDSLYIHQLANHGKHHAGGMLGNLVEAMSPWLTLNKDVKA